MLISFTLSAKTILIVGDSISAGYGLDNLEQGWVNLLKLRLHEKNIIHQIINASITGDTTSGGLYRLPKLLQEYRPDIVIIELGGNDGLRGINLNHTKNNLSKMVELSLQNNTEVVLAGMQIPPNYGKSFTQNFAQIYPDVANTYSIKLIPFLLENVGGIDEMMQNDGIHPTAKAQNIILDNVWQILEDLL